MGIDKRSGDRDLPVSIKRAAWTAGFVLFKNLVLNGYAAQTRTPGYSIGQSNLGAGLNLPVQLAGTSEAEHRKIGPNFNPQVGFLERTDCICDFLDATFKTAPAIPGRARTSASRASSFTPLTLTMSSRRRNGRAPFGPSSTMALTRDDDIVDVFAQRLTTPFNIYKNIYHSGGVYNWTRHQLTYGSPQDRRLTVQLLRALRELLQRKAERTQGACQLSCERKALV